MVTLAAKVSAAQTAENIHNASIDRDLTGFPRRTVRYDTAERQHGAFNAF
jgi:hypothetical protein